MAQRSVAAAAGRRSANYFPKGRGLDPIERAAVVALIGEGPYDRALLLEYLHVIQDAEGCLPEGHLHGLADLMRLSMAEVFEVASFYAHFDIVLDGETRPPAITVRVCEGLSCEMAGAARLKAAIEGRGRPDVRVVSVPCLGACNAAPACQVGKREVPYATPERLDAIIAERKHGPARLHAETFAAYRAKGGFEVLQRCLSEDWSRDDVIEAITASGLRGLGGAGFPTGRKWSLVRAQPAPRILAINADEGEPGTFKDRTYLETIPHRFLEGVLIAAWAIEAEQTFIYLRDEYPAVMKCLSAEIETLRASGFAKHTDLQIRRGAGAYICGEESAMIESIEGKKGWPRHRPPYVAEVGAFGRPTLVNNVETVYWVPQILTDQFVAKSAGEPSPPFNLRTYSVSGRVAKPGLVVAPAGTTVNELISKCGGMARGHIFKAYLPGGASGGILPARLGDLPLEFGALAEHGCFVGSHAVIVLSDADDMRDVVRNLMAFFAHESCGQCTPCRSGTDKAVRLIGDANWDVELFGDLATVMRDASICGLGQAAPNAFETAMRYFPEEFSRAPEVTLRADAYVWDNGT